jgi:glutamate formiminotransferase
LEEKERLKADRKVQNKGKKERKKERKKKPTFAQRKLEVPGGVTAVGPNKD